MSEIQWPAQYGYTIFSDDVRHELYGKVTLVGVYTNDLTVVGTLPITIPKLCLSINYFEKMTEGATPLELWIFVPSDAPDSPSQKIEIPPRTHPVPTPEQEALDVRAKLAFLFEFTPFTLLQPGLLKVRIKRGDDLIRLGALKIDVMAQDQAIATGLLDAPQGHPSLRA
jgi:hypothetical protein